MTDDAINNTSDGTTDADTHVPDMTITDDSYDLSSMMEITRQNQDDDDTDSEQDSETDTSVSDDEDFEDADESDDLEGDDSSEEDDFGEESTDRDKTTSTKDQVTFKVGDKEVSVSKDAEVEIKVDGKRETITLQEALNQASGGINVSREINRVKERETKLETQISQFKEETAKVNANAEALLEIKDPYELCEFICDLKGGDPDQLLEEMIKSTVEHLNRYKNMSDRELQLDRENRKFKREQRAREATEKVQKETATRTQQETQLVESLEAEGFTKEDFFSTIDELQEKAKNGEELGFDLDTIENPTEDDIIDYMVAKDLDDRVVESLSEINENLLEDDDFIGKAKQAILRTESLSGKMSQTEVTNFLEQALQLDNKALGESLSKKAKDANSKKVSSREQEDEDEGPGSLADLNEMLRNVDI